MICTVCSASPTDDYKLPYVLSFIQTQNIRTTSQFIEQAPVEWLGRQLLIVASGSAQDASPLRPRVILQNRNSNLIFGIAGGTRTPENERRIEAIEFDEKTAKYTFYEIELPDLVGGAPKIVTNPKSCFGCHAPHGELRPNWELYGRWPGLLHSSRDANVKTAMRQHLQTLLANKEVAYQRLLNEGPRKKVTSTVYDPSARFDRYFEESGAHLNLNLDLQYFLRIEKLINESGQRRSQLSTWR